MRGRRQREGWRSEAGSVSHLHHASGTLKEGGKRKWRKQGTGTAMECVVAAPERRKKAFFSNSVEDLTAVRS